MMFLIGKVLPHSLIERIRQFNRLLSQRRDQRKSTEQVFSYIYEKNLWGGSKGKFNSGSGTTEDKIVSPYISTIQNRVCTEGFAGKTFVDLGCGDFRVGKRLQSCCSNYIGVDIVKPLVQRNQSKYGSDDIEFVHLNIIEDDLPEGDVCFLRQVLQHLSNRQISAVLKKLDMYEWVFITEHHPSDNPSIIPNRDKVHGAHVRVYDNSGVYLSEAPFNLPQEKMELILEAPGSGLGTGNDQGIIKTWLYKP